MAKYASKYKKKKNPRRAYLWICLLILVASSVWGVSAKYIYQREQDLVVEADMFYFTSDLLTETGAEYTLSPYTETVTFTVSNAIDDLRFTTREIQYEYYLNGAKQGETKSFSRGMSTSQSQSFDFQVTPGKTYTVRVVANAGYTKTLSATFVVPQKPNKLYKHLDVSDSRYVLLTVWTEDVSGNVTVRFPAGLIPDATGGAWAAIDNFSNGSYGAGETTSVPLGANSSICYRFFKENPTTSYSLSQFEVTIGEGETAKEAVAGTP